ncbi:hypothetical protein V6N11_081971 [Hibiscus sabdariffa]|uniref:Integrase catalytic domain-containing protein n=1 Tax=Hibiscus sabdariffa TaxID=183260 RepID=A0ABR2NWD7_9ROSI
MELLKDYDLVIDYHRSKANVVVDALSHKPSLVIHAINANFRLKRDQKICVPNDKSLQQEILKDARSSPFSVHPGSVKIELRLNIGYQQGFCNLLSYRNGSGSTSPWTLMDFSYQRLAELYVREIIRLHGVPNSIISDRDPRFISRFWKSLQTALGTQVKLSTSFHPQTDGQSERVIQVVEDKLRACVIEFYKSWEKSIPLVESAYNNSYQTSIKMAPFEALYGRRCKTPLCWLELGESKSLGPKVLRENEERVAFIHDRLKATFDRQKAYFGKKGKLSPRFIGPFEIIEVVGPVAYRLALPPEFSKIHNVFHVSMLRKYRYDPSYVLKPDDMELYPNLSYEEEPVQILACEVKRLRNKSVPLVKVLWKSHKTEEAMWELEELMKEQYPQLFPSSKFEIRGLNEQQQTDEDRSCTEAALDRGSRIDQGSKLSTYRDSCRERANLMTGSPAESNTKPMRIKTTWSANNNFY